jgi:hypothetical protein
MTHRLGAGRFLWGFGGLFARRQITQPPGAGPDEARKGHLLVILNDLARLSLKRRATVRF